MPIGDENPAEGDAFNVWCNVTQPGTFSKIFYLGFSDEQDLAGADSPGSFVAAVKYTWIVAPDGSATYTASLVPEPSAMILAALGGIALLVWRRR